MSPRSAVGAPGPEPGAPTLDSECHDGGERNQAVFAKAKAEDVAAAAAFPE